MMPDGIVSKELIRRNVSSGCWLHLRFACAQDCVHPGGGQWKGFSPTCEFHIMENICFIIDSEFSLFTKMDLKITLNHYLMKLG